MGIVHLERYLLWQLHNIIVGLLIFDNCRLDTRGDEEILLLQTQFFPRVMVVIRIEHLYDRFSQVLLLYRFVIVAPVKGIQLEVHDRLRIPDPERIDYMIPITNDWIIIGNRENRFIIFLHEMGPAGLIIFYPDISPKPDLLSILRPSQFKRIPVFEPVVRFFYLITIFDLLLEHSVPVPNTAAIGRISQSCQGVQETGGQPSQTSISQRWVWFLILDDVQINAHLIQSFFDFLIGRHIDQIISKGASQQEFHRHIVDHLRIVLLKLLLSSDPVIDDRLLYRVRYSLKQLLRRGLLNGFPKQSLNVIDNFFLKYFLFKSWIIHFHLFLPFVSCAAGLIIFSLLQESPFLR